MYEMLHEFWIKIKGKQNKQFSKQNYLFFLKNNILSSLTFDF